jgi:hypothetical protein
VPCQTLTGDEDLDAGADDITEDECPPGFPEETQSGQDRLPVLFDRSPQRKANESRRVYYHSNPPGRWRLPGLRGRPAVALTRRAQGPPVVLDGWARGPLALHWAPVSDGPSAVASRPRRIATG